MLMCGAKRTLSVYASKHDLMSHGGRVGRVFQFEGLKGMIFVSIKVRRVGLAELYEVLSFESWVWIWSCFPSSSVNRSSPENLFFLELYCGSSHV